MIYTDEQIKENLTEFIAEHNQPELVYVISYALGFYGYITNQIWDVIRELRREGLII